MTVHRGWMRRAPLLGLSAVLTVGWVVVWSGAALSIWQDAALNRELRVHGREATALVTAVGPAKESKLELCRQALQVSSPIGGRLAFTADDSCASPWAPGEHIVIVVDPDDPRNVLAATDVQDWLTTQVLPVIGITVAAVAAGYPLGRLMTALGPRRPAPGAGG